MVNLTTRSDGMLDLMFTSPLRQMNRCKTMPPLGNSYHDVVLLNLATHIFIPKPKKRVIHQWKNAKLSHELKTNSPANYTPLIKLISQILTTCGFL
jgi:hypothetical protein